LILWENILIGDLDLSENVFVLLVAPDFGVLDEQVVAPEEVNDFVNTERDVTSVVGRKLNPADRLRAVLSGGHYVKYS
jgi:hypothetical protein